VLGLLSCVLLVAGFRSGLRQRHDRVAVLGRVPGEVVSRELSAAPALVEGVLEQIPPLARLVESLDQLH
jgi:hypothetical protein